MTDNFFHKCCWITDLHFGRAGNSPVANQDNIDFLEWVIDRAKSWGADTLIMGGDWYDNRYQIHLQTNHYSMMGLEMLNKAFSKVIFILGNHDLYHKEKRTIASTAFAEYLPNITIMHDPTTVGNVTFLPWLIGDEQKKIKNLKSRYVFAHLEMSGFMMNSQVILPTNPALITPDQFQTVDTVFTGHFHKRQQEKRIFYTGNIMPFNYSDVNDADRGMMLLEWGKEPILESWPDQPLYRTIQLSALLADEGKFLKPKMSVKVEDNLAMSYEESQEVKEFMFKTYGLRKFELIPADEEEGEQEFSEEIEFKDVDQMVIEGLQSVESKDLNNAKLIAIYQSLSEGGVTERSDVHWSQQPFDSPRMGFSE